MKISTSENADPNYLVSIVEIKEILPHPDADRLKLVSIFGNTVVVGLDTEVGEKVAYFPVESCISAKYLSWANMYEDTSLNADGKTKGYFNSKRRVKAVRLRGVVSQGIIIPVRKIAEFFKIPESKFVIGESFDTVGDELFVEKYKVGVSSSGEPKEKQPKNNKIKSPAKRIKPNQFRFHSKTTHLGRAYHVLKSTDVISISSKLHGSSFVYSKVKCFKNLSFVDRVAKFLGAKIEEEGYETIYSSRTVIKSRTDGEYTNDIWGDVAKRLDTLDIPDGISIYGEIVGFTRNGKAIQKKYDYSQELGSSKFYVYRITQTSPGGEVLEYCWQQIKDFCDQKNIDVVPTYFHGKAADLFDIDSESERWNDIFFENLKEVYLDKPCELCKNEVIREGICLRIENSTHKNAWKFKSPLFVLAESADRDKGETNIEEES